MEGKRSTYANIENSSRKGMIVLGIENEDAGSWHIPLSVDLPEKSEPCQLAVGVGQLCVYTVG